MINCSVCDSQDYHYSEDRSTSIGCYEFWYPLKRVYVCDNCMIKIQDDLRKKGVKKEWWPFEIRG